MSRVRRHTRIATLAAALLILLALPGPVAADTCACDPIQPFLVTDAFDESHVTYRHATNPGIIYASNKSGSWVKQRLTNNKDEPFAIGVDANQKVSIVFQREIDDDVEWRLVSNRGGEWDVSRLPIIHRDASGVKIRIDPDRNRHLAWTRDESSWYATNASGTWVRRRLDNAMGNNTQLALDDGGHGTSSTTSAPMTARAPARAPGSGTRPTRRASGCRST